MQTKRNPRKKELLKLTKEQLIGMLGDAAKNWLAHDGLWFLAAETKFGMDAAIALDEQAWTRFTVLEAKRIMKRQQIEVGCSGLPGLKKALQYRLYAYLNEQEIIEETLNSFVFQMNSCRVQLARQRDKRKTFPCKSVGIIEYGKFAETIDPRIQTTCLSCPPDPHPESHFCAWRFSIPETRECP